MTARADVLEVLDARSRICARCDGALVVTRDAIGRERLRCARCDGISRIRPHPDEVLLPQGLVRAPTAPALPAVAPGQLRCQRCARGVDGDHRFCAGCAQERRSESRRAAVYPVKACRRCGAVFQPTGPRSLDCEACR